MLIILNGGLNHVRYNITYPYIIPNYRYLKEKIPNASMKNCFIMIKRVNYGLNFQYILDRNECK